MTAKRLTPPDKAAVLLLALGQDVAAQILKELAPREVKRIISALSGLERIEEATVAAVLQEFQNLITQTTQRQLQGGSETARRLVAIAEKARGQDLGLDVDDRSASLRTTLQDIDTKKLAAYLRHEHPQTIALILAHLDGKRGGDVLKQLPDAMHIEIIRRIATLDTVDPANIEAIDEALRAAFDRTQLSVHQSLGGTTQVAQMLATMDRSQSERYLSELNARDPSLAEAVSAELFTFADLIRVDDAGIRLLLAETPRQTLLLALKQPPPAVLQKILHNISERARKTLLEDIEAQGKVRRDDVEAAQRDVAARARRLSDEGKLTIHGDHEGLV